jgi:hypothetical protein
LRVAVADGVGVGVGVGVGQTLASFVSRATICSASARLSARMPERTSSAGLSVSDATVRSVRSSTLFIPGRSTWMPR